MARILGQLPTSTTSGGRVLGSITPQVDPMDGLAQMDSQPGLFKSLVQGAAKPFLRTAETVRGVAEAVPSLGKAVVGKITGDKQMETEAVKSGMEALSGKATDYGYFGKISPIGYSEDGEELKGGKDVLDAVGVGAELASWAIGGGGAKKVGEGLFKQGLKTTLKESVKTGIKAGGTAGLGLSLQDQAQGDGFSASKTALDTLFGAGLGGATGLIAPVALRPFGLMADAVQRVPRLLGAVSDAPTGALQRHFLNPSLGKLELETPEQILKTTRDGVIGLRKSLSASYESGKKALIDKFTGERLNLGSKTVSRLDDIADEFGLESIPQNESNVSLNEAMDLYKEINSLYNSNAGKLSPKYAIVRQTRNEMKDLLVNKFGGKGGDLEKFFNNYASEKGAIDAIDSIVKTVKRGDPIADTSAQKRLLSIFDEDKSAYLNAIVDFENRTGINVIDRVARNLTDKVLPSSISKAPGGLPIPSPILDRIIKLIAAPLVSPKGSAFISELAGKMNKGIEFLDDAEKKLLNDASELFKQRGGFINLGAEIGDQAVNLKLHPEDAKIMKQYIEAIRNKTDLSKTLDNAVEDLRVAYGIKDVSADKLAQEFDDILFKSEEALKNAKAGVGTKLPVNKDINPLITEARKYKSAEEFVKAKQPVYHGSSVGPLKKFSNKKGGAYFTDEYADATGFAGNPDNVYEGYLNFKKPLVIDAKGAKWDELNTKWGKSTQEIVSNAQKEGYDGVTFKNIVDNIGDTADWGGQSTIHYAMKPEDAFVNESQLTDIWNKANKK